LRQYEQAFPDKVVALATSFHYEVAEPVMVFPGWDHDFGHHFGVFMQTG